MRGPVWNGRGAQPLSSIVRSHRPTMTEPYRAHHYSGRENGLMVMASATALRELGARLTKFEESAPTDRPNWSAEVTSINVGSAERPFALSFHVEHSSGCPPSNVPAQPKSTWLLGVVALLAVIGMGTVAKWVIGAF
jgi:hypothetical protein